MPVSKKGRNVASEESGVEKDKISPAAPEVKPAEADKKVEPVKENDAAKENDKVTAEEEPKLQPKPENPVAAYREAEKSEVTENPPEKEKRTVKPKNIPTKKTLNLCMKEKSLISPMLFVPILVIILVLAAVIGYFGVYKRFEAVNEAQAKLDATEARLQQVLDSMSDPTYDELKKEYNRYYYEDYDTSIADKLDVLELLERRIFPVSSMRSLSISGKTISTSLTGLTLEQVSELIKNLNAEPLVESVAVTMTGYTGGEGSEPTVNMTVTLADASKGGK